MAQTDAQHRKLPVSPWGTLLYFVIVLAGAFYVLIVFFRDPGINHYPPSRFIDMVEGRAHRPYVCRMLIPATVRVLTEAIPLRAQLDFKNSILAYRHVAGAFRVFRWEEAYFTQYLIAAVLLYAMLLGFLAALAGLCSALYDASAIVKRAAPLLALVFLPCMFRYTNYLYDVGALFFFTLGLLLMARRWWLAYLPLFVLACLNRETAILLVLVFAIHFWRSTLKNWTYAALLGLQIVLWVAVKATLYWLYRDNPGSVIEWKLGYNLWHIQRTYSLSAAMALLGVVALAVRQWGEKPAFLKHGLVILIPLAVAGLFVGALEEPRIYYEVYPIVILLAVHTLADWVGIPCLPRSAPALKIPSRH